MPVIGILPLRTDAGWHNPVVDDAIARTAAAEWLGPDTTLEPLAAMNSSTWEVRSGARRFVMKISNPSDAPGLDVAAWLANCGVKSGAPERYEVRDGRLVALLRFVDGRQLVASDALTVGATLGRVHAALVGAPVPPGLDRWPWPWLDAGVIEEPALRSAAGEAIARAEELAPRLTHGILHGDPAPEAFLELDGNVGLIDWGAAVHGPLLYDVASARMYAGESVVAGYAPVGPLDAAELALVPAFLAFRWALQAWYFSDRITRNDLTGLDGPADNEAGLADAGSFLLDRPWQTRR